MNKFDFGFIDLDDTIYDTKKFKEDIYKVFQPLGIGYEDFIRAYRRAAELPKLGYFHYTFEKQIEAVREFGIEVPDAVLAKLNGLLAKNYIISDAKEFLAYLKRICGKVILLTAGTRDFQARKIEAIQAARLVDEVNQIDGGKDEVLRPLVENNKMILFINDNLDENIMIKNAFPAIEVLTKFNSSYWTDDDCEKSGLPWFKTLKDIQEYLQSSQIISR